MRIKRLGLRIRCMYWRRFKPAKYHAFINNVVRTAYMRQISDDLYAVSGVSSYMRGKVGS